MQRQPQIDTDYIRTRLEDATATLQSLPMKMGPAKLSAQSYGYVPELVDVAAGLVTGPARKPVEKGDIERMDEAFEWLAWLDNRTYRRIVAARSIVNHHTGRCRFSWREIAAMVGATRNACVVWHGKALECIAARLGGKMT